MSAVSAMEGDELFLTVGPAIGRGDELVAPLRRIDRSGAECGKVATRPAVRAPEAMGLAATQLERAGWVASERGEQAAELGRSDIEQTELSGENATSGDGLDTLPIVRRRTAAKAELATVETAHLEHAPGRIFVRRADVVEIGAETLGHECYLESRAAHAGEIGDGDAASQ
jgi:hypothetical protein